MAIVFPQYLFSLLSIIVIDLVLAGDNAILIGMVARSVPKQIQRKVILFGTIGAILVRSLLIFFVTWLLQIPFLLGMGGVLLIWIAYGLLLDDKKEHTVSSGEGMFAAIKTIVIADIVMSLDNVLAIAGASNGSFWLVLAGLLISVPVMVWGSTIILTFIERFPAIVYIGSAILAFTAAHMIMEEPHLAYLFDSPFIRFCFIGAVILLVLGFGHYRNWRATANS